MKDTWKWAAPVAAALIALAAAACDGGSDDDDGDQPTAAASVTGDSTPAATRPQSGEGSNGGDAAAAYRSAVGRFIDSTFRAEYRVTAAPEDEIQNASMVIYKRGADRIRTDITADQEGERLELVVIDVKDDPDGSGFCLAQAGELGELFGIEPDEGVCFASDPTQGEGFGFLTDGLDDLENEDVQVLEQSERQIAGEDGDCFRVIDDSGEENEVCLGGDGELLFVAGEDGSVIEATDVSGDVDDGDFELPYEVRDLSAPPPGAGAGQ